MDNRTIDYYDNPENPYADQTLSVNMSALYTRFQKYLPSRAVILDAGCGSGRDSLHFLQEGYTVKAIDASMKMCEFASNLIGQKVDNISFQEIEYRQCFDGIWACASLLHVPESQQKDVFFRLMNALVDNGVIYASWKYGVGAWVSS